MSWEIYKSFPKFSEAVDCKLELGDEQDSRVIYNPNSKEYEVLVYENKNPFRSRSQMRRMGAMETRGELRPGTMHRWRSETRASYRDLPERLRNPVYECEECGEPTRGEALCSSCERRLEARGEERVRPLDFYLRGKRNPGAAWHRDHEKTAKDIARLMTRPYEKGYYTGAGSAHRYSADESEKMGMNPDLNWQRGGKYYIGELKDGSLKPAKIKGKLTKKKFPNHKRFYGPYKSHLDLMLSMEEMISKKHRNPPGRTEIYDNILAIEAKKGKNSLWPNEKFRHDFKGGATVDGLPDGSLHIRSKKGKRLWKNIDY